VEQILMPTSGYQNHSAWQVMCWQPDCIT